MVVTVAARRGGSAGGRSSSDSVDVEALERRGIGPLGMGPLGDSNWFRFSWRRSIDRGSLKAGEGFRGIGGGTGRGFVIGGRGDVEGLGEADLWSTYGLEDECAWGTSKYGSSIRELATGVRTGIGDGRAFPIRCNCVLCASTPVVLLFGPFEFPAAISAASNCGVFWRVMSGTLPAALLGLLFGSSVAGCELKWAILSFMDPGSGSSGRGSGSESRSETGGRPAMFNGECDLGGVAWLKASRAPCKATRLGEVFAFTLLRGGSRRSREGVKPGLAIRGTSLSLDHGRAAGRIMLVFGIDIEIGRWETG